MSTRFEERLGASLGLVILVGLGGLLIYSKYLERAAIEGKLDSETSDPVIELQFEALKSLTAALRDNAATCGDVEDTTPCVLPTITMEGEEQ